MLVENVTGARLDVLGKLIVDAGGEGIGRGQEAAHQPNEENDLEGAREAARELLGVYSLAYVQPPFECEREDCEHRRDCGRFEYERANHAECLAEHPRIRLDYDAIQLRRKTFITSS